MGIIDLALSCKFKAERIDRAVQRTKDPKKKRLLEIERDIALDRSLRIVNQFPREVPEPYIEWFTGKRTEPTLEEIQAWREARVRRRKYRLWITTAILITALYFLLGRSR